MEHRRQNWMTALVIALLAITAAAPAPTVACVSAPAPFDSFTEAVPDAGTVVIGTVGGLADREVDIRFRLHVDEVVRGRAPAAMRFSGLSGGEQLSACGDKSVVQTRDGDRLALAMSAASPGEPLEVDAVALVGRTDTDRRRMPRIEQLTARQVRRLAGMAADGSQSRRPYDAGPAADNLITERVAPGLARVSARGTKHDLDAIRQLDVSPDDRVWAATRDRAFQLGQRKEYRVGPGRPWAIGELSARPQGWAVTTAKGVWRFEEDRGWRRISMDAGKNGCWWPMMTTDGSVWAPSMRGPGRYTDGDWTRFGWDVADPPPECLDRSHPLAQSDCEPTRLAEAPDGSVWLGYALRSAWVGGGLRRFDGEQWAPVPDPLDGRRFAVTHLASYPGGLVWALLTPSGERSPDGDAGEAVLAEWDGERWTVHEVPAELQRGARAQPRELEAGPDGSVWLSRPLARFDGEAWSIYEVPAHTTSQKPLVQDLSIAADGSAWLLVRDAIKYRTTEPDGIYVLDPARAVPLEVFP